MTDAPKTTINDILDELLETAHRVLKYQIGIAFGAEPPEGSENYNNKEQHVLLDMIKPMLNQAEQTKQINAKSSTEVIKMLKKGTVSVEEAMKILRLIDKQTKVEESELRLGLHREAATLGEDSNG